MSSYIIGKTITETFLARVRATPDKIGFQYKPAFSDSGDPVSAPPAWKKLAYREYYELCRLISYGLMGLGIKPGDRVAILSQTRIEWSLCDMAILGAKAVTVPIYPSNTPDDVVYTLNHSDSSAVIVEDASQLEKILEKRAEAPDCLPKLNRIIVIEPTAMRLAVNPKRNIADVMTLQALRELGRREEAKRPEIFDENLKSAGPEDWITICYTTGTTGVPKGVPLTHDNMMSVIEDALAVVSGRIRPDVETILSFLPFSHVLGKVESMIVYAIGCTQFFAENVDRLPANMVEVRPTVLFAVPRIFEKAYNRILSTIETGPALKRTLFGWALEAGRAYHEPIWSGGKPSLAAAAEYRVAQGLVFRKIAERFGGRLRYAICGGAALPKAIGEFFEMAGVRIVEGYGLTETCAPVTLNDPDHPRFGTVGKPLGEVNLKIADDGEILVKSRKVFHGYYKQPEETAHVLVNGWFHTGDVGHIDEQGYLHITDRKKDLIVTSAGKNIAPQRIEKLAKAENLIAEFVVHGDHRNYLTALVTLNRDAAIQHANEHNILFSEYSELIKNPKILSLVEKTIERINQQLASYETIKKFLILPKDFTIEGGELTASLKVRRNVIQRRYKAELDSLYKGDEARASANRT